MSNKSNNTRVAILGIGAIGQKVLRAIQAKFPNVELIAYEREETAKLKSDQLQILVVSKPKELIDWNPDLAIECAGQPVIEALGSDLLEHGVDLMIASVGALTNDPLREKLNLASKRGKAQLITVSGAIGGLDALSSARVAGLEKVNYIGRKPPAAWNGTDAEKLIDLGSVTEPTAFFKGTARQAASKFPKNANVTAAVALAGIGFDKTEVVLMADPTTATNIHEVDAQGPFGRMYIRLENSPLPDNPKTSWLAALSIEAAVENYLDRFA